MAFAPITKTPVYFIGYLVFLGFFGEFYYLFDLFSHFYLQYALAVCLLLPWYLWRRYRIEAAVSLCLLGFLAWRIAGADLSAVLGTTGPDPRADVFYMNSEYLNADIAPIAEAVERSDAGTVALVELNSDLYERIRASGRYTYSYYYPDLVFSFWFFSREPVLEQRTILVGRYPIGYFRTAERAYYVVHPLPPMDEAAFRRQKEFFAALAGMMAAEKRAFLAVGDFNSTVYSSVFRSYFLPYFHRSAYSWGVDTPLALPIDHALSAEPLSLRAGPRLSSDHVPLLVDFRD